MYSDKRRREKEEKKKALEGRGNHM